MSLDFLKQAYQKNSQANNGQRSLHSSGSYMNLSRVLGKYIKHSTLSAEDKTPIVDFKNMFDAMLDNNSDEADAILARYENINFDVSTALGMDPKKNDDPYALMIIVFIWASQESKEDACWGLSRVEELLENPVEIDASFDIFVVMLWVILSGVLNYGRPG